MGIAAKDGLNIARRVMTGSHFTSAVPADGRIVIYAPDGAIAFDSRFDGEPAAAIAPGSLVLFIGNPGTSFEAKSSEAMVRPRFRRGRK